jgi:hypothetical protein
VQFPGPTRHFRQIDPLATLSACPLRSDRVRTFAPQRFDALCQIADSCTAATDDVWAIETEASTVLRLSIQIQSLRMREKADEARAQALREISPGLS